MVNIDLNVQTPLHNLRCSVCPGLSLNLLLISPISNDQNIESLHALANMYNDPEQSLETRVWIASGLPSLSCHVG